jgi:glutaconyl-CoA/methylmalonyl-CoA decarboxylase subunit gamma
MKKYAIRVNGKFYEVEVEEIRNGSIPSGMSAHPSPSAPAPALAAAIKSIIPPQGPAGKTRIAAPMTGTVLSIHAAPGDSVLKDQVVLKLEAMKMENEIYAPCDGTIASVHVSRGVSVNAGDPLVDLE